MELKKNQYVLFEDGHKEGFLEARWSEKHNAFYSHVTDENGDRVKIFSTTIIDKPERKKRKFIPTEKNCPKRIYPCGETEKAWIVEDGDNGKIVNFKQFYKYYAKSICYIDELGNIYAPAWA